MSIKQSISIVVSAVIGGIVGAGIVLSEVRAQVGQKAGPLTATSLDVVDSKGATRCKISAEGDQAKCAFIDPNGVERLQIGVISRNTKGCPFISLSDVNKIERVGIGLDPCDAENASGYLRMANENGINRLNIDLVPAKGPMVSLSDNYGKPRGGLMMFDGTKGQDAGLLILGKDKSEYASLMVDGAGPMLYLEKKDLNACMGVTKELGSAAVFGRESGSPRMYVGINGSSKPVVRRFKRSQKSIRQEERIQKLLNDAKQTKEIQIWSDDENAKP